MTAPHLWCIETKHTITNKPSVMKIVSKTIALFAIAAMTFLFACKKESSASGPGSTKQALSIFLTDAPNVAFDQVLVDIRTVEVCIDTTTKNGLDSDDHSDRRKDDSEAGDDHGSGGHGADDGSGSGHGSDDNGGGSTTGGGTTSSDCNWITIDVKAGVYDLLSLRNGAESLLANGTLPKGKIRNLRLTLGDANSVVVAGQTFPLQLPAGSNQVIIALHNGSIAVNGTSTFSLRLDFDASRSIVANGNVFTLKPVIKAFCDEKSGRIEGNVLPSVAGPITITAFNATDTAAAIAEKGEGEYKIRGLLDGTYSVLFQGSNGYKDTTVTNVVVKSGSETKIPTITLHP
jgi:hypothetical protein